MSFADFLVQNRHHHTIDLGPETIAILETLMSALTDLTTAVTALEAAETAVAAEVAALNAGTDTAALEALTGRINSVVTELKALVPAPAILTISPASLPMPALSTQYSEQLSATGGDGSYTFSLASGDVLPPGLSLSSAGDLSGTPTTSGTYPFTIDVVDTTSPTPLTGSASYTLTF